MLKAVSPLDGRYFTKVDKVGDYFSEYALMGARIWLELKYLLALNETGLFPPLSKREIKSIEARSRSFSEEDYTGIKEIESTLNHDVKSCEVYLRQTLKLKHPNMIHFGLTSEDINNLSHTLLMKKYCIEVQLPQIRDMLTLLCKHIAGWKSAAFPARTHGQMASPTTAGKEMAVFASRLLRQAESLETFRFRAKLNGATGNYSAFDAASSEINWQEFSRQFIESLDLEFNPVTTQIEDHDNWGEFFTIVRRFNSIIMDMNQDIWVYLMLGYLKQATIKDEVGSSTMPHKVNPINFENSEGNLGISNALLDHFANKLSRSRLQRDLSDSTVERNFGVAMGHAYLGLSETMRGLKKLEVNEEFCKKELDKYPELLAEPIQTILRRENFQDPYMLMKNLTRGRELKIADLNRFIDTLKIKPNVRRELAELRTVTYFGKAEQICDDFLARSAVFLKSKNGDTE